MLSLTSFHYDNHFLLNHTDTHHCFYCKDNSKLSVLDVQMELPPPPCCATPNPNKSLESQRGCTGAASVGAGEGRARRRDRAVQACRFPLCGPQMTLASDAA